MKSLDLEFVRSFFPALKGDWIFMDNAGGTQTVHQVADRISDYLLHTNVQLGASYEVSVKSGARVDEAQAVWASAINASSPAEVAFGSSTTMLLQSLSRSLGQLFQPGDEVIVTNCDHEANIGPWLQLQGRGVKVKSWSLNPDTFSMDLGELEKLMTDKTRLVAFTHVSNILGTINPVKAITRFVHERGAMVCVDGVAYAPHRLIDVHDWDVDFYAFSLYKVYGPHYALLYGKQEHFEKLPGINHFFIDEVPYKIQPGNVNYELSYGLLGITDYFRALFGAMQVNASTGFHNELGEVFNMIADHEETLTAKLLDYLLQKPGIQVIGDPTPDRNHRVSTISFIREGTQSSTVTQAVDRSKIGIRYGDFYARRLIDSLGLTKLDGVVRVSMVHYNTPGEVEKLIRALEDVL
jgi:cysteine desulfurase family protein (TIGR01976 family)